MTGQELLNAALDVCGLRDEQGGIPSDVQDAVQRSVSLINLLLADNEPLAARVDKRSPAIKKITQFSDSIAFPESITRTVLVYGLARMICLGEDRETAADLNALYENAKAAALRSGRAVPGVIAEVYR